MDLTKAPSLILDAIFYSVPELKILQGAYLKVAPGSISGLIGPNGSGKSTLLRIAAGQIKAESGLMIVGEDRIASVDRGKRFKHISYLQQESMLPADLTVGQLLRKCHRDDLRANALFGALTGTKIRDLSGGERRLLELQLILGLQRSFVLLDEPFTGVEPKIIEQITASIVDAAKNGTGFLISDHYIQYLLPIIDDAYVMHNRQCTYLPGKDLSGQLTHLGYLRASLMPESTTSQGAVISSREEVRQMYDSTAVSYAAMMDSEIDLPFYKDVFARLRSRLVGMEGALLDTSCGSGHMLEMYRSEYESARQLIGIDLSPKMIETASLRLGESARLEVGDMTAVDKMSLGPISGLLSFFALHHLAEPDLSSTFEGWNRVLAEDGFLSIAAWEGGGCLDYGESSDLVANRYPIELVVSKLGEGGFKVTRQEIYRFADYPVGALLVEATASSSP